MLKLIRPSCKLILSLSLLAALASPAFAFELMVNEASDEAVPAPSLSMKLMPGMTVTYVAEIYKREKDGLVGLNREADEFQWTATCEPMEKGEKCEHGSVVASTYRRMNFAIPRDMGRSITLTITHVKKQAGDPATTPAVIVINNTQARPPKDPKDEKMPGDGVATQADGDSSSAEKSESSGGANISGGGGGGGGGGDDAFDAYGNSRGGKWGEGGYGRNGSGGYGSGSSPTARPRENPEPIFCVSVVGRNNQTTIECQEVSGKQVLRTRPPRPPVREQAQPKEKELDAKAAKKSQLLKKLKIAKRIKALKAKAKAISLKPRVKRSR